MATGRLTTGLAAAAIALIIHSSPGVAEVTLGTREVLLDNEQVQVIRLTYPVGTESGMHTHEFPNRVVYMLKGGVLEFIPGDPAEQANVRTIPDGTTLFLPGSTHNVRNIGHTEVVILETELK